MQNGTATQLTNKGGTSALRPLNPMIKVDVVNRGAIQKKPKQT